MRDTLITYRSSNDIIKTQEQNIYIQQFKEETVALVTEQGYTVIEAADAVGVRANQIYNWKQRIAGEATGARLTGDNREELLKLRKEVKKLRIEKEILKNASVGSYCQCNTRLSNSKRARKLSN